MKTIQTIQTTNLRNDRSNTGRREQPGQHISRRRRGALVMLAIALSASFAATASAGTTHQGTTHQGTTHQGTTHQGTTHQGTTHQGTTHQGTTHQGTTHQGTTHQGTTHQGTTHQGTTHQGTTHQGAGDRASPGPGPVKKSPGTSKQHRAPVRCATMDAVAFWLPDACPGSGLCKPYRTMGWRTCILSGAAGKPRQSRNPDKPQGR